MLRQEHGDVRWPLVMLETADYLPSSNGDGYAWRARASYGGDVNRLMLKTEGEGVSGDLEHAEVQALYSRAITRYFNLQAGVRQDFQPRPRRTYATIALEGLAPFWFDIEAALFVSDEGDLLGRLEGSYDLRLTQRVVLEPRAELNLAAQDVPELESGSGLSDLELGLRLRYAIQPEFAPYVGVVWQRSFGDTADFARAAGRDVEHTRFLLGLRAWF
jgi:copper resistance protein B